MQSRIMYLELKTGYDHNGPARIGRVSFSKTGKTLYYGGKAFERIKRGGVRSNHRDVETGEEYWISGVKRNREDRHWAGSGPVEIDEDVREDYFRLLLERPKRRRGTDSSETEAGALACERCGERIGVHELDDGLLCEECLTRE